MKIFFGVDQTVDKNNTRFDGEDFIAARVDAAIEKLFEENNEQTKAIIKKAMLPLPLRIVTYLSLMICIIIVLGISRASSDHEVSIQRLLQENTGLLWVAGISAVIFLSLLLYNKLRFKKMMNKEENEMVLNHAESLQNSAYNSLGVPSDAVTVDILVITYKNIKGKIKPTGGFGTKMMNIEGKLFTANGMLSLSFVDVRYDVPLDCITEIRTIKKRVALYQWNKETPYNKGEYKQYKLYQSNNGITMKYYHMLMIKSCEEEYALYFPPYERDAFEQFTKETA